VPPENQGLDIYSQAMPFSLEAEQSVLGALMLDSQRLPAVMELLKPEYFYRPQHQDLYAVMVRMFTMGEAIDPVTVLESARRESIFETPEDAKIYLTQLAQTVPGTQEERVRAYAVIIQEKYYLRSLIAVAREVTDNAFDPQADAKELLNLAEQRIYDIRQGREVSSIQPLSKVLVETYDHLQRISGEDRKEYLGLSTGYKRLDEVITGLNKSDFILIAARPGVGKTAFALNIASNVAKQSGKAVAIFSLEMSREQLAQRLLSAEALVELQKLLTGSLTEADWVNIARATQTLAASKIYVDDNAVTTVAEIKAKLRRIKDLGLVVIDYLQLMTSGRNIQNRVQEVSEMTRNLKLMAKELNIPVITLSQLSRSIESRSEHKPMLSDLRESGSIEQDADIVMFLHREAMYNQQESVNDAKCIVAKNRHGETRSIDLYWDGQFTRYSSVEYGREE
jgi:replicative DNA helicase